MSFTWTLLVEDSSLQQLAAISSDEISENFQAASWQVGEISVQIVNFKYTVMSRYKFLMFETFELLQFCNKKLLYIFGLVSLQRSCYM